MRLTTGIRNAGLIMAALIISLFVFSVTLYSPQPKIAFAGDDGTSTPTLAPSKTAPPPTDEPPPTVQREPDSSTAETVQSNQTFRHSLTQGDLSVLTANVQRPNGLVWFNDYLYTACTGDGTIYEIESNNGETLTYIWGIRNAHALHAEENGQGELDLWVPDFQANTFSRVTRFGVETIASDLEGPWGIALLDETSFLISNLRNSTVSRIDRDGATQDLLVNLAAPTGLVKDGVNLYVANNGSTRRSIEWYDIRELVASDDPAQIERQSLVTGLQNTTGMTLGADGKLYFAYSLGNRGAVGRVDPAECRTNGGCAPEQVEIVVLTELAAPLAGLTLSDDMRLFVHTMFSPDIYWAQL
jgi:hypothetical protein